MSKVLGIVYSDKLDETFDNGTYTGYTECCGASVSRGRCGCDEYCPECMELLDWSDEDDK